MGKRDLYKKLATRYVDGTATTDEMQVFFHLLNQGKLKNYLEDATKDNEDISIRRTAKSSIIIKLAKYSVAAAIVAIIAVCTFLWLKPSDKKITTVTSNQFKNDIAPGGNKAFLTLADGTIITLDRTASGEVANQGSVQIVKEADGIISYKSGAKEASPAYYNRVSTPIGGQYQVRLADGTRVWLNALSSIRFPSVFDGSARTVELSGEAYFEVTKNRDKPFYVSVNGMQVEVLGTHFNVNAYPDEPSIKTTLLAGMVKLVRGTSNILLKPGDQGQTNDTGGFILSKETDVDEVVAWKNGYFSFEGADVKTVMRQIARWYGVQVHYVGEPTKALFGGEIGRDLNLTQVLIGLSKSRVHFQLEGTTLTVLP